MIYLFKMMVVACYYIEEDDYIMEIFYKYSKDRGDYFSPPSSELEIKKVLINSEELTQLFWDYIETEELLEIIESDANSKL
tara:strand:+ start:497 stop:739 length:243 start_codon:yes stop_codon:yes gene_type:complete